MRSGRRDGGQSTVELAFVLPLVVVMFLAVLQVALIAQAQVLTTHAAREAARSAAVGADPHEAAVGSSGLRASRMEVTSTPVGDDIRVAVTYRAPTDVPIVGAFIGDVTLQADATMRREPEIP